MSPTHERDRSRCSRFVPKGCAEPFHYSLEPLDVAAGLIEVGLERIAQHGRARRLSHLGKLPGMSCRAGRQLTLQMATRMIHVCVPRRDRGSNIRAARKELSNDGSLVHLARHRSTALRHRRNPPYAGHAVSTLAQLQSELNHIKSAWTRMSFRRMIWNLHFRVAELGEARKCYV